MVTKSRPKTCAHYWIFQDAWSAVCRECGGRRTYSTEPQPSAPVRRTSEVELLSVEALVELDMSEGTQGSWARWI